MDNDIDKSHVNGVNTDGLIEVGSKKNRLVALFFFFFRMVYQYLIKLQMKIPVIQQFHFFQRQGWGNGRFRWWKMVNFTGHNWRFELLKTSKSLSQIKWVNDGPQRYPCPIPRNWMLSYTEKGSLKILGQGGSSWIIGMIPKGNHSYPYED